MINKNIVFFGNKSGDKLFIKRYGCIMNLFIVIKYFENYLFCVKEKFVFCVFKILKINF